MSLPIIALLQLLHSPSLPEHAVMQTNQPYRAYSLAPTPPPNMDLTGKTYTSFAYSCLTCSWVFTLASMVIMGGLALRMNANKRQFHQLMILVQAVVLLGYSLTLGGYGLLPYDDKKHILIGRRDEFALHYVLPLICLPVIVYVTNNVAGIFLSEGLFIIGTLTLSAVYGAASLWLPRDWLGSFVSALAVLFAVPYFAALVNTWPASVKAAPRRVRQVLKAACGLQIFVIAVQLITFDLAINATISVDFECLILCLCDIILYSVVPGVLIGSQAALRDVYSREEYIRQTKRAAMVSVNTMQSLTPSLRTNTNESSQRLLPVPRV